MKVRSITRLMACASFLQLLGLSASAAASAPANVLLARGRTEPTVAVDSADPSSVVVGSNTNYSQPVAGTYPTGYFTSHDGGRTFRASTVPIRYPYTTGADPSVISAANGTLFFSYLGETPSYCSGGHSAVLVTASYDRGDHFRTPAVVDANPADDKPALALRSPARGRVHLFSTWTRWNSADSEIWFARSLNGGDSFSAPVRLYASKLDNFGSAPVVGAHGRVYVFWSTFPETPLTANVPARIMMRASHDDGVHFGPPHAVTSWYGGVPQMAQPGSLRNLPGPAAVVDGHGTVYVAWAAVSRRYADGHVDANILMSRSTNGGQSWSRTGVVNDVGKGDRFMPSLSLLPDGSVGVAFYDRRESPWRLAVYAARIRYDDAFHRSANVRVNRANAPIANIPYIAPGSTCFAPGRFFGDYIGTAGSPGGQFCVVWSDSGLQVPNETDVWFARIMLPPLPSPSRASVDRTARRRSRNLARTEVRDRAGGS